MNFSDVPNLQIGITDRCNLECYMCRPSLEQSRAKFCESLGSDMSTSTFENIISNSYSSNFGNIMLCWVGEPLMHPNFMDFIEILKKYDNKRRFFKVLTFNTNGVFFNKKKIDEFFDIVRKWDKKIAIVFSIDAFSKKSFQKIKKRDLWDRVIENVEYFFKKKSEFDLSGKIEGVVQFLVLRENKDEALDFYDHFTDLFNSKKMNWDMAFEMSFEYDNAIVFKETLLHPQEESHRLFEKVADRLNRLPKKKVFNDFEYKVLPEPGIERLSFYENRDKKLYKYSNRPPCISPFMYPTVHVDGRVTACCRDNSLELTLGDLSTEDFQDIWNGSKADKLRKAHLESKLYDYPLCFFCENYTEYFFNDSIVKNKYNYQNAPRLYSKEEYYTVLEKLFYNRPDLSIAGKLHDHFLETDNLKKIEEIYSFLYECSYSEKSLEILASLKFKSKKYNDVIELLSGKDINLDSQKLLAQSYEAIDDINAACELYEKIIKQNNDIHILRSLAGIYSKNGYKKDLLRILKKIINGDSKDKDQYLEHYIELQLLEGKYMSAWKNINTSIIDIQRKDELLKRMANELLDSDNLDNVRTFLNQLSDDEKNLSFLVSTAEILRKKGNLKFAKDILDRLPDSLDANVLLWRILQDTEDKNAFRVAKVLCDKYDYKEACETLFFRAFDNNDWSACFSFLKKLKKYWELKDHEQKIADIFEVSGKYYYSFRHLKKIAHIDNFLRRISLLEKADRYYLIPKEYDSVDIPYKINYFRPLLDYYYKNGDKKACVDILSHIEISPNETTDILGIYISLNEFKKALGILNKIRLLNIPNEYKIDFLKDRALIYRKNKLYLRSLLDYFRLINFKDQRVFAIKNLIYILIKELPKSLRKDH